MPPLILRLGLFWHNEVTQADKSDDKHGEKKKKKWA